MVIRMKDTKKNRIKDTVIRRKSRAIEPNLYRSAENQKYLAEINEKKDYARLIYGICFLVLTFTEVMIALFVHDEWIRPYVGDVLVVIVIYTFIRIIIPHDFAALPIIILLFACLVEGLQYIHIVDKLGLGEIEFFRVLLGTVGDIKDIVCYAIGCILLILYEMIKLRFNHRR